MSTARQRAYKKRFGFGWMAVPRKDKPHIKKNRRGQWTLSGNDPRGLCWKFICDRSCPP